MSSHAAPRCRHIKVNGTQCGSPALRHQNFCFYHQQDRPTLTDCYYKPDEYPTGVIALPIFEDAHSIQTVIRKVVQMVLQNSLERKTAGLVLYALQIASSNLKRMELEKPQPEQVVTDLETEPKTGVPMAAITEGETGRESSNKSADKSGDEDVKRSDEDLPFGTIQACYRPNPPARQAAKREGEFLLIADSASARMPGAGSAPGLLPPDNSRRRLHWPGHRPVREDRQRERLRRARTADVARVIQPPSR